MDIDKFVLLREKNPAPPGFGSLMDIDKFVLKIFSNQLEIGFGSLMDIDKFVPQTTYEIFPVVSVL